eukprot:2538071-Prymnesium_polylepis.1
MCASPPRSALDTWSQSADGFTHGVRRVTSRPRGPARAPRLTAGPGGCTWSWRKYRHEDRVCV